MTCVYPSGPSSDLIERLARIGFCLVSDCGAIQGAASCELRRGLRLHNAAGTVCVTTCISAGVFPIVGAADQQIGEICIQLQTKLAAEKLLAASAEPAVLHTPPRGEVGAPVTNVFPIPVGRLFQQFKRMCPWFATLHMVLVAAHKDEARCNSL